MITTIKRTRAFKRDNKRAAKSFGLENVEKLLADVLVLLTQEDALPAKYRDHALYGEWVGCRDCHIRPDLILIYEITEDVLTLHRVGSHSELF